MELELEVRHCANEKCTSVFKTNIESNQIFHSNLCKELDKKGKEKQSEWQKWRNVQLLDSGNGSLEKNENGSEKKNDSTMIKSMLKNFDSNEESTKVESKLDVKEANTQEKSTLKIKEVKTSEEKEIETKIEEEKMPNSVPTTEKTEQASCPKFSLLEGGEIQQLDYSAQLGITIAEISNSVSYLNESVEQMNKLMKNTGTSLDSLNRQISVRAAREVRESLKAKIDIARFAYKLTSDNKRGA